MHTVWGAQFPFLDNHFLLSRTYLPSNQKHGWLLLERQPVQHELDDVAVCLCHVCDVEGP